MTIFPSSLPQAQLTGYMVKYRDEVLRTKGDDGKSYSKIWYSVSDDERQHQNLMTGDSFDIKVRWLMTEDQFAVLEGWWQIFSGIEWFESTKGIEGLPQISDISFRFIEPPSAVLLQYGLWLVNAIWESRSKLPLSSSRFTS